MTRFRSLADYIFGRNALIGAAALMLLLLSGYATWSGMSDFILGVQSSGGAAIDREIVDGLSVSTEALIILLVTALTFLMWLALRETFRAYRPLGERLVTLPLYLFLALWSVGFGYGFWWSLIAGPTATQSGLAAQVEGARDAALGIAARLEAVRARLDGVGAHSERQMSLEASAGGTCGVASGAGRGPLFAARRGVTDQVARLRGQMSDDWLASVQADLDVLNERVAGIDGAIQGATIEERQVRFNRVTAEIRGLATSIATRSNALGATFAAEMRALAASLAIEPGEAGFSCFDSTLAQLLLAAADEADQPAELALADAAFNEGAAGVANAVLELWENLGAYAAALPSYFSDGGDSADAVAATGDGTPITGRDLIALLATLGVDLGLFALTVLNPPTAAGGKRDSLDDTLQTLYEPSERAIAEISKIIRTSLEVSPGASLDWVRRHFFSHLGYSYFVIPNLADCQIEGEHATRALAINQLSGVLTKLKIIQAIDRPRKRYVRNVSRRFGRFGEENRWREALDAASTVGSPPQGSDADASQPDFLHTRATSWSFYFFSVRDERWWRPEFLQKARQAMRIAGWGDNETHRPEVFVVYHEEGLEPILTILERGEHADGDAFVEASDERSDA